MESGELCELIFEVGFSLEGEGGDECFPLKIESGIFEGGCWCLVF